MVTIISRRQLYDRVWQRPITHLAKEFGISDVGLRKACKRRDIPTPPAGHWAKLAHGKTVAVTKLFSPGDDHAVRIWREPKIPKWEQRYNGRLALRLEAVRIKSEQDPWGKPIRGTFADSRTRDVTRMVPAMIAAVAAIAAAKRGNAAYGERRRVAEETARQRWQEEERRRYEWLRAVKLVDELIELERQAQNLRLWLDLVCGRGLLPRRTRQLTELVEKRLHHLHNQLSSEAVERRVERERLFANVE